jgi:hypothetical protein
MHARTDSTAKAEAAKSVAGKPRVCRFHEPFWLERFPVREYFRVLHNCTIPESVSKVKTEQTRRIELTRRWHKWWSL